MKTGVAMVTALTVLLGACAGWSARAGPPAPQAAAFGRRADGTVLVAGKPFFPFGFYHVSWANGGTPALRLRDVRAIGAGGFNLVATDAIDDADQARFGELLDIARHSGVYVLPHGLKLDAARRLAGHPALLGFKISDDSNLQASPQEVKARDAAHKRLAPDRLTYISLGVGINRPETPYFGVSDMVGNQSYPIGDEDINVVYRVMRSTVRSALERGVTPLANLQTFAWTAGGLYPTPLELANMTYQALLAGVKGVVFYAYRSPETDMSRLPEAWEAVKRLAAETRALAPALLDGRRIELTAEEGVQPPVVLLARPEKSYLMILNNDRESSRSVDVALPAGLGRMRPLFQHGSGSLTLTGNRARGRLEPLGVAVYELSP